MPTLQDAEAARDAAQKVVDDLNADPTEPTTEPVTVVGVTVNYSDGSTVECPVPAPPEAETPNPAGNAKEPESSSAHVVPGTAQG